MAVCQDGSSFSFDIHEIHSHPAHPGGDVAVELTAAVKRTAKQDVFRSAGVIVEEAISEAITSTGSSCPNPSHLKRTVNRSRQTQRPPEPTDLHFELDTSFTPAGFLRKDIRVGEARHLLFFTDEQLAVLDKAKTWYLDGTFKLVRRPFSQLFSVHAFIKGDSGKLKQVPLAFAMMSRRTKADYKKVQT